MVVQKMFFCEVNANTYLFKQGDNASSYFIIESGTLQVIINGQIKKQLQRG